MKNKILLMKDTTKKKFGAALLCGALVATIGSIPVFAANSTNSSILIKMENGVKSYSTDGGSTWNPNTPEGVPMNTSENGKFGIKNNTATNADGMNLLIKIENGVKNYSTDGGNTWSESVPDGISVDELNGKLTMKNNIAFKDANGVTLMTKVDENGVRTYSTDGGNTWSENVPDGITINKDENSTFIGTTDNSSTNADGMRLLIKVENGVRSYSTDGGNTWSENVPDGISVDELNGKLTMKNNIAFKDANGVTLMTKVDENGVRTYSTDGGNTWSENVPDGVAAKAIEAIKKLDDGKFNTAI